MDGVFLSRNTLQHEDIAVDMNMQLTGLPLVRLNLLALHKEAAAHAHPAQQAIAEFHLVIEMRIQPAKPGITGMNQ
jgi:hypothetical protein